jgi:hypothetical protein
LTLTAQTLSKVASSVVAVDEAGKIPALFTKMSTRPEGYENSSRPVAHWVSGTMAFAEHDIARALREHDELKPFASVGF